MFHHDLTSHGRGLGASLSAAAVLALLSMPQAHAASAFSAFVGSWSGGGDVSLDNGTRERVRCKANYVSQSDDGLQIHLDCASDSYKVQVVGDVAADPSGSLSGTWQELSRQASGRIVGRLLGPGEVQVNLEGAAYTIQLSFNTHGAQQAVAMQVQGAGVRSVAINLHKG